MGLFTKIHLPVILLLTFCRSVSCKANVITNLFAGYDRAVRPDFDKGKPTVIRADIYVESFENIAEENMEFKVSSYFRQRWTDSRLAGKLNRTLTIKGADIENIWVPDPYCYNARESNMMIPDSETCSRVTIEPNGDVFYSKRVIVLASCNMDLRSFPHDSQDCFLKFGSYSYTKEDIVYKWSITDVDVGTKVMAQFEYKGAKLSSDIGIFATGNYSTITVKFSFKRRVGYYFIQVYLPCIFVVALSWIVFWMGKDAMGDRMTLGITTILAVMFLLGSLNGNLPKVSYPKALDWYLLMSFTFVFLSLVECMTVFVLNLSAAEHKEHIKCKVDEVPLVRKTSFSIKDAIRVNKEKTSTKTKYRNSANKNATFEVDDLEMGNQTNKANKSVVDDTTLGDFISSRKETAADFIDKGSRVVFPLAFVIFNIVYWVYFSLFT